MSVALSMQHATRMRRVIFSFVECSVLQIFPPTLSHKRQDFGKKNIEYKMCIFHFFYQFVIPRRTE
jgi:hypothetical protein